MKQCPAAFRLIQWDILREVGKCHAAAFIFVGGQETEAGSSQMDEGNSILLSKLVSVAKL